MNEKTYCNICVFAYMKIYEYIHIYVYVYVYIYVHNYTYVHMYICTFVHIYTYMHSQVEQGCQGCARNVTCMPCMHLPACTHRGAQASQCRSRSFPRPVRPIAPPSQINQHRLRVLCWASQRSAPAQRQAREASLRKKGLLLCPATSIHQCARWLPTRRHQRQQAFAS